MAQDSLQCLAQLASMHGPVFPDENAQISYLAHLMEGLLSMINGWVTIIVTAVVFVYVLMLWYWSRILAQVWRNVTKVDTKLNSCYWETLTLVRCFSHVSRIVMSDGQLNLSYKPQYDSQPSKGQNFLPVPSALSVLCILFWLFRKS